MHARYWKTVLCRVPEILPSAFYRGTRQSNILPSATLGKIKHSAKVALPSARHSIKPGSRQNWALSRHSAKIPLGKRWPARDGGHLPSDFAECLMVGTRQFFFIFKNLFCRVPAQALGKKNYFLKTYFCRVPAHGTRQIFFLKKIILPSAIRGTRQNMFKKKFAECLGLALGKISF